MKKILLKLYYKYLGIKDLITIEYNKNVTYRKKPPIVKGTDETIDKLVNGRISISRYGDGEFALMNGKDLMFQPYYEELSERLKFIITSNEKNHIVGIPNVFESLEIYTDKSKEYWSKYLNLNNIKIDKMLDKNKKYYDTQVTRLYIDTKDKYKVKNRFDKIKTIWEDKDIVIVEGGKSRLGIGNNLFDSAKSISRIICPSKDAFSKYSQIIDEVRKQDKSKLILIALGPTATVLSYDLAKDGYHAIDIGHIDIEYEWFLQGAIEKCPINNKYIGEVEGGTNVSRINSDNYMKQIISTV